MDQGGARGGGGGGGGRGRRRSGGGWWSRSGEQEDEEEGPGQEEELGGGGWPLGLHVMGRLGMGRRPDHFLLNLFNARARNNQAAAADHQLPFPARTLGDASPFFLSTPSISSLSSSDLDTESTGSFFPERSTTLGTLIGIHNNRRALHLRDRGIEPPPLHSVATQLLHSSQHSVTTSQRLQACCCAAFTLLMRCASAHSGGTARDGCLSVSLAHLLELERKAAHSQDQEVAAECESCHEDNALQDGGCSHERPTLNTLFDDDGILPPHPSGAPLKVALHQLATSPTTATYLSADWSASLPIVRKAKHCHSSNSRSNSSLCLRFWKIG